MPYRGSASNFNFTNIDRVAIMEVGDFLSMNFTVTSSLKTEKIPEGFRGVTLLLYQGETKKALNACFNNV